MINFNSHRVVVLSIKAMFCTLTAAICYADCDPNGSPFGGGSGASGDPYQICSVTQLNSIGDNYLTSAFILEADIDLQGISWNIIGENSSFTGKFDGNGHTVSNLTITRVLSSSFENIGMFGEVNGGSSGFVKSLNLIDVSVTTSGASARTGGLAGRLQSPATNITVDGSVTGIGIVGLLAGYANSDISNCTATGVVTGSTVPSGGYGGLVGSVSGSSIFRSSAGITISGGGNVGGLVGYTDGVIEESFSFGSVELSGTVVSSSANAGGLVGFCNSCSLLNTYSSTSVSSSIANQVGGLVGQTAQNSSFDKALSVGAVSGSSNVGGLAGLNSGTPTVTAAYWDTESSGQSTSAVGSGLTTTQAKSSNTYSSASFDMDTIWSINDGVDYPKLRLAPTPLATVAPTPTPAPTATPTPQAPTPQVSVKGSKATVSFSGKLLAKATYVLKRKKKGVSGFRLFTFAKNVKRMQFLGLAKGQYTVNLIVRRTGKSTLTSSAVKFTVS